MDKIYISQPIRGKTPQQIKAERDAAMGDIIAGLGMAVKLANPVVLNMDKGEVWCLGRDIQRLSEAVEAFFLPGWEDEPGCRVERSVCEYFNIVCCDLSGDAEHGYAMPGGQMRL